MILMGALQLEIFYDSTKHLRGLQYLHVFLALGSSALGIAPRCASPG